MDEEHSPIEIPDLRKALEVLPDREFVVMARLESPDLGHFTLFGFGGAPILKHRNHAAANALRKLMHGARYPVQHILDALSAC